MFCRAMILIFSVFLVSTPAGADTFDDARAAHRAKDYNQAMQLYERAAKEKVPEAMFNLYIMYANGEGVAVNNAKAIGWLKRAAKINFALAQFNLAFIYESGDMGAQVNNKKAVKFYKRAAKNGSVDAQYRLGLAYKHGSLGLKQHPKSAVHYFKMAAEGGEADAQYYLAESYNFGSGIAGDPVQAYKWYFVSVDYLPEPKIDSEMGFLGAMANAFTPNKFNARLSMTELEQKLTPAQLQQAKQDGQAWLSKNRK